MVECSRQSVSIPGGAATEENDSLVLIAGKISTFILNVRAKYVLQGASITLSVQQFI